MIESKRAGRCPRGTYLALCSTVLLLIGWQFSPPTMLAQQQRVIQGKVMGAADEGIPRAVVYLKDMKSLGVKSALSIADGSYRFGQLSDSVDYEVWAELDGKKSSTRAVSSFDKKKQLTINLKLTR